MTMPSYTDDCWACVLHRNRLIALYSSLGVAVAALAAFVPVVVLPYIAVVGTATLVVSIQGHPH